MMFNPIHKIRIVVFNFIDRRLPVPDPVTIPLYRAFMYAFHTNFPEFKKARVQFTISQYIECRRNYLSMLQAWVEIDEMYRRRWDISLDLGRLISPLEFSSACVAVSMERLKVLLAQWSPEDAHA